MEIADYIRTVGKRKWLLIIIPVLAAAVSLPALLGAPREYRTVASVQVMPASDAASVGAIAQTVANFRQAVESDTVASAVARASGLSESALRSGLHVQQLGTSSVVEVRLVATNRAKAMIAVDRAAHLAAASLEAPKDTQARAEYDSAKADLAAAQKHADESRGALDGFTASSGLP